jgi:hypothetical protein
MLILEWDGLIQWLFIIIIIIILCMNKHRHAYSSKKRKKNHCIDCHQQIYWIGCLAQLHIIENMYVTLCFVSPYHCLNLTEIQWWKIEILSLQDIINQKAWNNVHNFFSSWLKTRFVFTYSALFICGLTDLGYAVGVSICFVTYWYKSVQSCSYSTFTDTPVNVGQKL